MKLFHKRQNLINELKKLKFIKASDDFKASLFERLNLGNERFVLAKTEESYSVKKHFFKKMFFYRTAPLFMPLSAIIAIIAFIGGGVGMTFASQSALPGEVLYPVKIISEKALIAIASGDDEKARLHFEFSSERLNEVAELAEDSVSDPKLAEIAVEGYKKELSEGQIALFSARSGEKEEETADLLINITSKNKEAIAKIGNKTKNYKIADSLKDAWEDTVEHNDKAALITLKDKDIDYRELKDSLFAREYSFSTLEAVSSSPMIDLIMQKKVLNKITEAEKKISEANKYFLKREEKGIDVSEAKIRIDDAKKLLDEAKNFLEQAKYESAFNKAKEAYKIASDAQKIVKRANNNGDNDEDELEMFKIYYIPENATSSEEKSFNSTTTAGLSQPASIIHNINILKEDYENGDGDKLNQNENRKERKSEGKSEGKN